MSICTVNENGFSVNESVFYQFINPNPRFINAYQFIKFDLIHLLKDKFLLKALLSFIIFTISVYGFSQNPYYHTIDKTLGLPSNSVYDIFQDSKGFIWFATNKGICRYDGSKFINYTSDSQSSVSGSNISEDRFGRIWYCNFDGYLYYVENGKLKTFHQLETIGYFKYGIIDDFLYLIQKNKVIVYDLKFLKPIISHKIEGAFVYFTLSDHQKFYVLSDYLYEFSGAKKVKKYPVPEHLKKNYTSAIIQKTENGLAIVSKNQTKKYYLFKDGQFTEKEFSKEINFVQNLCFTNNESWICSTNGIYRNVLSRKKESVEHYFPDYNISSIYKDRQNNFWISTLNRGLILIEDFDSKFISMSSRPIVLGNNGNQLLISTEKDELLLSDFNQNQFQKIYQGTSNHSINQMLSDDDLKTIFFTASTFKILKKQKEIKNDVPVAVKEIKKIDSKYYAFSASGMSGIFSNGNLGKSIWDSVYHSEKKLDAKFGEIAFFKNSNGKSNAYNSENQTIYYAKNIGLFAQNLYQQKELFFQNKKLFISKLADYKDSVFALSTNGKIFSISKNNTISVFNLPENIKTESIYKIKIVGNSLFIFGEKTLFEYNFINKNFRKILSNINELDVSDVVFHQNQIIFATSKGLLIKNKKESNRITIPKLIVNQILVNDKITAQNNLLNLDNSQNNIEIQFSVLSFVPSQKSDVFYRINDNHWQSLENDNRALIFNSLSSGDYKIDFQTKTENQFSEIQSVKFSISKPFWLKLGFIIPLIILISALIYFIFRWRISKIRKQNQLLLDKIELEKNMNQSKLKAIKSQMNPHFFYNALNTIQAYVLSNEKKLAVNYLSKFSLLTRTILEMSEKETVTISEETKTINLYLEIEKARFDNDFDYEILVDETIDSDNQKIPSMLLQPYIENAIKHGLLHKKSEKKLQISFNKNIENLEIKIDDNGIGRKKSQELNVIKTKRHKSFATDAMQKRIDLLNLNKKNKISLSYIDKSNDAENSLGTTVIIKIPLD